MYQKLIKNIISPLGDKIMGLSINKNLENNTYKLPLEIEKIKSDIDNKYSKDYLHIFKN